MIRTQIPNILTVSRILLSGALLFMQPLSLPFFILYTLCGISDVLDGFFARKLAYRDRIGCASGLHSRRCFYGGFYHNPVPAFAAYPVYYPLDCPDSDAANTINYNSNHQIPLFCHATYLWQ